MLAGRERLQAGRCFPTCLSVAGSRFTALRVALTGRVPGAQWTRIFITKYLTFENVLATAYKTIENVVAMAHLTIENVIIIYDYRERDHFDYDYRERDV